MTPTCTCSPSIRDPRCPVAEHRVMAKAVSVVKDFLGGKDVAVSFSPVVVTSIDFYPPPFTQQAVRLDFANPCAQTEDGPLVVSPAEHAFITSGKPLRSLGPAGEQHDGKGLFDQREPGNCDGQPLAPDPDAEWRAAHGNTVPNPIVRMNGTDDQLARDLVYALGGPRMPDPNDGTCE